MTKSSDLAAEAEENRRERMESCRAYVESIRDSGGSISLREAARLFALPKSSFTDFYNGRQSRREAHAAQQILTPEQELVLLEWIKFWGARGMPLDKHATRAKAMIISGQNVSVKWIYRFLERHPSLKTTIVRPYDKKRANAVNRPTVERFYAQLINELQANGIPQQNIFNADEKGITCGNDSAAKVLVDRKAKHTVKIGTQDRDITTVIECICANGSAITPMMIFKGARQSKLWHCEDDLGMHPAYVHFLRIKLYSHCYLVSLFHLKVGRIKNWAIFG